MNKFFLHFTSAYGTLWAAVIALALLSRTHINIGEFGIYGFPVIALIYAGYRNRRQTPAERRYEELSEENRRLKQIIRQYETLHKSAE